MKTLDPMNTKYFRYAVGSSIGKDTPTDIQARCIVCGDSETDARQKRLHLYVKPRYETDIVHCFNCGWKGNMYQFLKETNTPLYEQYRKENRENSFNSLRSKRDVQDVSKFEGNFSVGDYDYSRSPDVSSDGISSDAVPTELPTEPRVEDNSSTSGIPDAPRDEFLGKSIPDHVFELPLEFERADQNPNATKYLEGRRLKPSDYFFSTNWVKIDGKDIPVKNCIIIPLWVNEAERIAYGFQARSIESKFFYTYIPPENSGWKVWNWYKIDRTVPTFVFESVFDARSSGLPEDRITAALGSDLIDERAAELHEVIYCFDNQRYDYTSKVKSVELLKEGKRVFVWPVEVLEKDTNDWLKNHPKHTANTMAAMILSNIRTGMDGIMRIKLKK